MDLFFAWRSTANIEVERATRGNEPEMARRASTGIETGNMIIQSWVLSAGGEMVSTSGVDGMGKVPAEKLDELADILERYEQSTDSRISVGVGFEPQEADTALRVAEARGGKPAVVLYNEDVAIEAHELEESEDSDDDLGPIAPEDEAELEGGAPESDGGAGQTLHKAEGDAKPGEASKIVAGSKDPLAAQMSAPSTVSPMSAPSGQPQAGPAVAPGQAQDPQQLKQAVASVLQDVKSNMEAIQELQQSNPQAFQSVVGLVQAFVTVARELFGDQGGQPMQKSESQSEKAGIGPEDVDQGELSIGTAEESKEHGLDEKTAQGIALDHLTEDPHYYSKMKKADGPMHASTPMRPGVRHETILPVGSQLDTSSDGTRNAGKVKVRRQDGSVAWVSVRAGQILSQDGHPISSRNPGGK
jgi:hypothetical protein